MTHASHGAFNRNRLGRILCLAQPFLFALFPVVSLYEANVREIGASVIIIPAAVVVAFTAVVFVLSAYALGNLYQASLSISLLIFLVFSYGPARAALRLSETAALIAWTIVYLLLLFLIIRARELARVTMIVQAVALTLIIVPLTGIAVFHLQEKVTPSQVLAASAGITAAEQTAEQPDIYYLIFDRHARNDTLASIYDHDNSPFTEFLKAQGFDVAEQSNSNYLVTGPSLAASLNLNYLDDLVQTYGADHSDWQPLYQRINDNHVASFLQQRGYTFINMGSWWDATQNNSHADININLKAPSNFSLVLLAKSVFKPLFHFAHLDGLLILDQPQYHYLNALNQFSNLASVPDIQAPHVHLCPRPVAAPPLCVRPARRARQRRSRDRNKDEPTLRQSAHLYRQ